MKLRELVPGVEIRTKAVVVRVIGEAGRDGHHHMRLRMVCHCGAVFVSLASMLIAGRVHSCGCFKRKVAPTNYGNTLPEGKAAANAMYWSYVYYAEKRKLSFALSREVFDHLTQKPCFYCDRPPSLKYHRKRMNGGVVASGIDRFDNRVGYTIENTVPCCTECNRAKEAHHATDLVTWAENIVRNKTKILSHATDL